MNYTNAVTVIGRLQADTWLRILKHQSVMSAIKNWAITHGWMK